jgi:hypothetical protein
VAVAVQTGIPAAAWLDDPQALFTAVDILIEKNRRTKAG